MIRSTDELIVADKADEAIIRRDVLRNLANKYSSPPNESVYEQSVRYGKLAYEAYCVSLLGEKLEYWTELSEAKKQAWIEVGTQIQHITIVEQNEYIIGSK